MADVQGYLISPQLLKEIRKLIRYENSKPKGRPGAVQATEPSGKAIRLVKLTQDLNANGKATADIYLPPTNAANGGVGTVSTGTIKSVTVYDPGMIASGKKIVSGSYLWVTNARRPWEIMQASACPS